MKMLLMLILLCISTLAWSAGVDTRWQFDEYDGMISEAWTPEMKGNFLAFSLVVTIKRTAAVSSSLCQSTVKTLQERWWKSR